MLNLWLINIKFNLLENCCCIRGKHLGYVVSVKKKRAPLHHIGYFPVTAHPVMISFSHKYETHIILSIFIIDHLSIFTVMPLDLGISLEKLASWFEMCMVSVAGCV